ncbi:DUF3667 domain-containing protein [Lutibacter sp.]|uniref:DUF3667 domain-containing protein n=1 Tax=Lutibacter sp. TaxID=1925666 RepID=UPI0027358F90|nr:DUF3667 domain-containing protein [Lutibacter sp.]MDP3311760.1 DUF3667 domain-containing protein [Lutibacter sp.]
MKFRLIKYKFKQQIKGLECLNCTKPLEGNENFCSYCGQKNTTEKLTFSHFISNLLNGLFSYDSRLWTTFIPLLIKPGRVSKDFIEGKRARFVNPFQLYLNVSIIFFIVLGITNKIDSNNIAENTKKLDTISQIGKQEIDSVLTNVTDKVIKGAPNDSTKTKIVTDVKSAFNLVQNETTKSKKDYIYHIKSDSSKNISVLNRFDDFSNFYEKNTTYTKEQALDSLGYKKTFWNTFYYQKVIHTNKNIEQIKRDGGKAFFRTLTSYLSISLFFFLPFFALFLKLVYWRRSFTYMEHLVFVFHVQTVFFLMYMLFYLLKFITKTDAFLAVFFILFLLYLYKALRYFYEQSRSKTILKFIILNGFYLFLASIGFIIVAIFSFLMA